MADPDDQGVYCGEDQETVISLVFNELRMEGSLPWEVILLSNLEVLNLDRNKLSGPIPSRMSELTRLSYFWTRRNKFRVFSCYQFHRFRGKPSDRDSSLQLGDDDALTCGCQS